MSKFYVNERSYLSLEAVAVIETYLHKINFFSHQSATEVVECWTSIYDEPFVSIS